MSPPPEDGIPETTTAEARRAAAWILEIPPEAAYVSTARLFVGAVARHFGVDEGSIGDLKLAVSEACNGAIRVREAEAEDRSIRIEANREGTSLSFEIEDAVDAGSSPVATSTEDLVRGLGLELIHALFPDATMKASRGGESVRLALAVDETRP